MVSEYHYLVVTANEVFVLLHRSPIPKPKELTESANLCCNALRQLSNDELFFRDVATLSESQKSNLFAFRQITGADTNSLSHFQYFWRLEKTLLISAGMDEHLVGQISSVVEEIIQSVRKKEVNVGDLRVLIAQIRNLTCNIANTLNKHLQELQEEEERRERAKWIGRNLYFIVGAAIVAIDASSLASTVGLTSAGTAVSGAVGTWLMSAAAPSVEPLIRWDNELK
jgi:hypothetical protein